MGNWDALIREGKVELHPLPLILDSELSGIVEAIGPEVSGFELEDEVYGVTNPQFSGAYVEYAVPCSAVSLSALNPDRDPHAYARGLTAATRPTPRNTVHELARSAANSSLTSRQALRSRLSGCYVQHDLAALMPRTSKHLVGKASFLQREHSPYVRRQFSAVEQFCDLVQPRCRHVHIEVR